MILVRHGESTFNAAYNVTRLDPGIIDPPLTGAGRRHAERAARALAEMSLSRLITSPYTRALQTADVVAGVLGLPVTVEPLVRERRGFTCDIGTPRTRLAEQWPRLDFDHLDEEWWPRETESDAEVHARCARFGADAATWPDRREVAVITHWGFVLALTGVSLRNGECVAFEPRAQRACSRRRSMIATHAPFIDER